MDNQPSSDDSKHNVSVRRVGQPQPSGPASSSSSTLSDKQRNQKNKKPKNKKPLVIVLIVIIVLAVLAAGLYYLKGNSSLIDESKYQAVYFENNLMYYGKLQDIGDDKLILRDVYYLQTKPGVDIEKKQDAPNADDFVLNKRGGEIHGPEDGMIINKDQVLYIENLKFDSAVSKAIAEDKKSQSN